MTLANIELLIILLLVAVQARDAWVKRDRAEEIRSATMEGMRKGFTIHEKLTEQAIADISKLYAQAYSDISDRYEPTATPTGTEASV